jgi:flagellar hook assembly protein FlgD
VAGTNCVFEFFDAAGNRVRMLGTHASSSGAASATWDGTDDLGRSLPEGIYYCCLGGAANPLVRKLVLTR